MVTDEEILKRHVPAVRARAKMELAIVHKLLEDAARAGYTVEVMDEEKTDDILDLIFNLEEINLAIKQGGKQIGWVFLVMGNDGYDLISDYTTNLESFLTGCHELANKLQENL